MADTCCLQGEERISEPSNCIKTVGLEVLKLPDLEIGNAARVEGLKSASWWQE